MNITITKNSAEKHLNLLYDLGGIGRLKNGNYVVLTDTGWFSQTPDEMAKELSADLLGVDTIREAICEIGVGGFRLPDPEIVIGEHIITFGPIKPLFSEDDEPRATIDLEDGTKLVITHKEFALDLEEQYFLLQHIGEDGNVLETCFGGLSVIAPMLGSICEERGIKAANSSVLKRCPACGEAANSVYESEYGHWTVECSSCGAETDVYDCSMHVSITGKGDGFNAYAGSSRKDRTRPYIHLYMENDEGEGFPDYPYASASVELDHDATQEDYVKLASIGYRIAAEMYEKHGPGAVTAEAEELLSIAFEDYE